MTSAGAPHPLGATMLGRGVNFSVYSRSAKSVELLLFSGADDHFVSSAVPLNRTYHYWHVFVPSLKAGQIYGFRVDDGCVLLDPYGRAVAVPKSYKRTDPGIESAMKSVVVDSRTYNWEGDEPLRRPCSR